MAWHKRTSFSYVRRAELREVRLEDGGGGVEAGDDALLQEKKNATLF
jgi:hypothetical protein